MAPRAFGGRMLATVLGLGVMIGAPAETRGRPAAARPAGVPEVVVRASPGPALWDVRKGDAEIVILGSVAPTPRNEAWNTRLVADALQGARVLMLSPGSTPGLAWADDFPDSQRYRLGQSFGRTLAKELAPATASRFGEMAAAIHEPWTRYSHYRPGPAGMILLEDSWGARGLTGSELDDAVVSLANAARVRVVKVDEGGALPLIDAMPSMSTEQHAACIGEAMDQFDREGADANAEFRAWASGDLAALANTYRPVALCVDVIPGGLKRRARAQAIWLKALTTALNTPGRAVALMDVSSLLTPSDLLDALRAQGATVTEPRKAPGWAPRPTPVVMSLPERLDTPAPGAAVLDRPRLAAPRRLQFASAAGVADRPARADQICIEETSAGTLLPHAVCHSRAEWARIEKQKSPNEVRDLIRNNASLRGPKG